MHVFVKDQFSARLEHGCHFAHQQCRIVDENRQPAAPDGIGTGHRQFILHDIGHDEADVLHAARAAVLGGEGDETFRALDADDFALRTDAFGQIGAGEARAAADIDHTHAGHDAGPLPAVTHVLFPDAVLQLQSTDFGIVRTEHIILFLAVHA